MRLGSWSTMWTRPMANRRARSACHVCSAFICSLNICDSTSFVGHLKASPTIAPTTEARWQTSICFFSGQEIDCCRGATQPKNTPSMWCVFCSSQVGREFWACNPSRTRVRAHVLLGLGDWSALMQGRPSVVSFRFYDGQTLSLNSLLLG
jgi:hypothetical protein